MDKDGDGIIDADELLDYVQREVKEGKDLALMKKMVKLLVIAGAVLALIILIITVAVVNLSKDVGLENGMMVQKGTHTPVATGSVDTKVLGTTLQNKAGDTLGVVQASKTMPLSSALPDSTFSELRVLVLKSPSGAHLQLTILGFVRLPNRGVKCGSLVKLFTAPGAVILDGDQMTFDDKLGPVFQEAGFQMSSHSSGRRMLQMAELVGIFNLVAKLDDQGGSCNVTAGLASSASNGRSALRTLSESYHIEAIGWIPCQVPDEAWCASKGATTHPKLKGRFFTKNLSLWRNAKTGSSKLAQSVSWDPFSRVVSKSYSQELGVTRTVEVVGGESFACSLDDTPPLKSLFDSIDPANAEIRKTEVPGETMFAFSVPTPSESPDAVRLELRITMEDKTGVLLRVQVWNLQQAAQDSAFSAQTFWQIKSANSLSVFPSDLFAPAFPDGCTSNKTKSPIPPRPCSLLSPERQQWDQENANTSSTGSVVADDDEVSTVQDVNGTIPMHGRRLAGLNRGDQQRHFSRHKDTLGYWNSWKFPGQSETMKYLLPVRGGFFWNVDDWKFAGVFVGRGDDNPIPGLSVTGRIEVGWGYPNRGPNFEGCLQATVGGSSKVIKPAVDACDYFLSRKTCQELLSYQLGEVCVPTITKKWVVAKVGTSFTKFGIDASVHFVVTGSLERNFKPTIRSSLVVAVDLNYWPLPDIEKEIDLFSL
jgi:hypothetical protein